jgi:hypothetical protein
MEYGTAGTYFLKGPDRAIYGVFKPIDEEAFAPNNPKGHKANFGSKTFRAGVLSGEGGIREAAAFLIGGKFSHVPDTTLTEVTHPMFQQELDS